MSSSPAYNNIVYEISNLKISELQEQKGKLDPYYEDVLQRAKAVSGTLEEVRILWKGIERAPVKQDTNIVLDDVREFLDIADYAMVSPDHVNHWAEVLREQIEFLKRKRAYACVYAEILKQELLDDGLDVKPAKTSEKPSDEDLTMKERINVKEFETFMDDLFKAETHEMEEELASARKKMREFCRSFRKECITPDEVTACAQGLMRSEFFTPTEAGSLSVFKNNQSLSEDTATLLTKKMKDIDNWAWPEDGVQMTVRRGIAGKYRYFAKYGIVEALFLQYIGVRFAVQMKEILVSLYKNIIVKKVNEEQGGHRSVQFQRRSGHDSNFLSMLPNNVMEQGGNSYDGQNPGKSVLMAAKNTAIRHLSTEAQLYKALNPEVPFTVLRSDIELYGSSIQHGSIIAMFKFLGVTDDWLKFMEKYLAVPMLHPSLPGGRRTRECGALNSHILSTLFGECLLFLMEADVYQKTRIRIHRVHDDLFLGGKQEQVKEAWATMSKFAEMACLKFNMEKSGSALIYKDGDGSSAAPFGPEPLPQSTVRWSSLVMRSDGLYQVSREEMEPFVIEMKKKLDEAGTVLSWIHAYNKYMAFFYRNFGECAYVFGKQHVEQIAGTLQWIQTSVLDQDQGNTQAALRRRFSSLLKDVDILDMWIYWPLQAGGLGMKNIFLELGALKQTFTSEEKRSKWKFDFSDFPEKDKSTHRYQEAYKEQRRKESNYTMEEVMNAELGSDVCELKPRTFEEYCAVRETESRYWGCRYQHLMEDVEPEQPTPTNQRGKLSEIFGDDYTYAERVMAYYGHQLEKSFGNLDVVDMTLIPKILVETIVTKALKWDE
ncbi:hypothetical protein DFQ28_008514 [Apophysomyces sp. BC1034]|nr:hypothetical protein DFQ30_011206 [Apophysomyces sp. BC1015]KAG0179738.1 hypothetical protein DFQ29_001716 [Apophysomyces sp. BC1021]KAG0185966.1 hypothetical protein DFQ28_008514 [Apophysomyces sp. BC1034]